MQRCKKGEATGNRNGVGNWREGGGSAAALFHPAQLSSVYMQRLGDFLSLPTIALSEDILIKDSFGLIGMVKKMQLPVE